VPGFAHKSVLEAEVLAALRPAPGTLMADGTLGGGGHAAAILRASAPTGRLVGCDRDAAAVEAVRDRLAEFAGRYEIRQGNFAGLADWVEADSCDGVLMDLGVSSPQLDRAERGFSFQQDGPLDMRMDQNQDLTAAKILQEASVEELAEMLWNLGGEQQSRRVAREIAREREQRPFTRTRELAGLMERISPRAGRKTHPATKVFLALRLAVNDELGSLERGLEAAMKILKPGGRLAVITFHPVEDRVVKAFGRRLSRGYNFPGEVDVPELRQPCPAEARWVSRKAIMPGAEELRDNPRSRSGQCRVLEKLKI
jgi:16S rRNA (cytosine1402-N4)-methyltransferase